MQRERIATKVEMADKKRVVTYKEYNCVRSVLAAVAKLPEVADTDELITLSAALVIRTRRSLSVSFITAPSIMPIG